MSALNVNRYYMHFAVKRNLPYLFSALNIPSPYLTSAVNVSRSSLVSSVKIESFFLSDRNVDSLDAVRCERGASVLTQSAMNIACPVYCLP